MKKIVIIVFILSGLAFGAKAQCEKDKKFSVTSAKTDYLDANNQVQNSRDEKTVVTIKNNDITVLINDEDDRKMTGTISSNTCDWKIPFKEGKSVIKASLTDAGGDVKDVTITLEGKDGKISFVAQLDNDPDKKIKLNVDKFE